MATDYTALDQLLDKAIQEQLAVSGGTGAGGLTPAQIEAYYGSAPAPKTGRVKETGKALGRGILGIPKLITRTAQGGALDLGALLGYSPEENVVAQTIGRGAEAIQGVQQGETLAPNAQFIQEHPIAGFVNENIEGALPWIAGAAASRIPVIGPAVLPAAAALSAQAEGTEQQMKRGVAGNEALLRSTPGALATGAMFAAMPAAMRGLKGVPSATAEGFTKGVLPGVLGRPGGIAKGALQGLVADAPYLFGQGEVKQAVDVGAGAMLPEEWAQTHTPEAIAHAVGSSLVGGAGFGALGGIGQNRAIEARREEYKNLHQPIQDDKTSVDLNVKPAVQTPLVQQNLFNEGEVLARPTVDSILPEGEVILPHAEALKVAKQLKKIGVTPVVTELGLDITGTRRTQISLPDANINIPSTPAPLTQAPKLAPTPIPQERQLDIFAEPETPVREEILKPEDVFEEPVKVEKPTEDYTDMPEELKEYVSDFMNNPETAVDASTLSQITGIPEETLVKARNAAQGVKPEPEGIVESPEGEVIPLAEATKRAKKLVGEATPESEKEYLEKTTREGWEHNVLADEIGTFLYEDGLITNKTIDAMKGDLSRYDDVPTTGKNVPRQIEAYKERAVNVLNKAEKEGVVKRIKEGFVLNEGVTPEAFKEWFKGKIYKKRGNAAEGVRASKEPTVENVVGEDNVKITKADVARIDKAAKAREKVTTRAQTPHTIFKERIKSFRRELDRIGGEIVKAKLTKNPDARKLIVALNIAKKKFRALSEEGHASKLEVEANKFYDKLENITSDQYFISEYKRLIMSPKELRKIFGKPSEDVSREEIEKYIEKNNPELKQIKEIITDLKSQARNIGRLELGEKLNEFREGVEVGKKAPDMTNTKKGASAEDTQYRREREKKFLADMSKSKISDGERIENADEILDVANASAETRAVYEKQKSNKQKSLFLKNLADKAWIVRDRLDKPVLKNIVTDIRAGKKEGAAPTLSGERQPVQIKNIHHQGIKTAKELEREANPELKAAYEKQQKDLDAKKIEDAKRIARLEDRLKSERKNMETREKALDRLEKEAEEKIELQKQEAAKERAFQYDKQDLFKKIQRYPEDTSAEFKINFNDKGKPISKAGKEFETFSKSKKTVGATSAIPVGAHKFVEHLADKFGLDRTFILTESDLKNSNIKDLSITAKEIYDGNGDYVGTLHSTTEGIDFLALNNTKIENTKTLINTLSHEVGHAIINKHFESASAETKQAVRNDFESWLNRLAEKDNQVIDELYQESGQSWKKFKEQYSEHIVEELATGGFKVNEESMFQEYLAEQIAKYIKVTESKPTGILTRFFNVLADKINYILRFANKEFAKNHTPIQSVTKWLDGFKKQGEVTAKKNAALKKKTNVTYDDFKRAAKQVHNTFNPSVNENIFKNMTGLVDASLADKGIVKQAWKGTFRLPWWDNTVRPATENYEKSLETNLLLKQFLKATSSRDVINPNILSLKNIETAYNKSIKTSKEIINKLLVEGDKEGVEWASPKDIKSETLKNISKEDFEIYKQTRKFTDQAWERDLTNQSDTLAYSLTENVVLQDSLGTAIRLEEINTTAKLKEFLEKQPSIKMQGGLDTFITPVEFNVIADAMYSKDGIKDFYKEYSRNYSKQSLVGYIPRERLDGAEWVVELFKKNGTKIFNQGFYTQREAQHMFEDFKTNPEKYMPHGARLDKAELNEPIIRPITTNDRFNTGEDKLISNNIGKVLDKFENVPNKEEIISAVRKEIMNHILAQHGMHNRIQRSEQLIEGYNEDSPLDAIQTALDKSAYRQSKMRYIIDQSRLLSKTKDVQNKNAIREYVSKTLEPAVPGSTQVQMFKNMTAVYFMGFRPLTALLQLTQLHTVGAAELGMHLKTNNIKGSAQGLLAKAELDMRLGKLSAVEKDIIKMAEERGVTWETSSQALLFKDVDAKTSQHFLGKRIVKVTEIALKMFQYMEQHNRQSSILAAYRIFSKGSSEFNQEAFDKAMVFNNNTNFMMNKGNVPYWAMKNPIGMSMYSLMSYTLNMANWMLNRSHGSLSDLSIDKWTQRQAFMKMLGYTAVLAGVSGLPFTEDLNKLIRKIFGRDLHLETKQFIKQNANKDIANLVADGVFAPLGVNISSNIAIRVPFLSGLIDGKTVGESVSGASGAMVTKGIDATSAAINLQGRKFLEAASPEVIAGALRAERLYREGQRGPSGKPVYFEGKPIKSTGTEALMQGLFGLKSERRANIMGTTDAEYKLLEYWRNKKKVAESKARKGDLSALQEFNRKLVGDKNARLLVKPLKLGAPKPNADKTAFEMSQ